MRINDMKAYLKAREAYLLHEKAACEASLLDHARNLHNNTVPSVLQNNLAFTCVRLEEIRAALDYIMPPVAVTEDSSDEDSA